MAKSNSSQFRDVSVLIPIKKIERDHVVYENDTVAMVVKVNSINLYLMSQEEMVIALQRLAGAFRGVNKQMSIVKLERPTDYSSNIEYEEELLRLQHSKFNEGDMDEIAYDTRLGLVINDKLILESYNSENKIYKNEFYIVIYNPTIEELLSVTSNLVSALTQLKLDPSVCNRNELIRFFHHFYNPDKQVKENEVEALLEENNDNIKEAIAPQKVQFATTKIKLNNLDAKVMSIYDYPLSVGPGWLVGVFSVPSSTCVLNLKPVSTTEAKGLMDKAITEVKTQALGRNKTSASIAYETQIETFVSVLQDIERGDEMLKLTSIELMVYGNNANELAENVKVAVNICREQSLRVDKLICRQIDGFISIMPTAKDPIMEATGRDIPCETLGAGFPFVFQTLNDKRGFLLGYNDQSLIFFDPKVRSPSRTNSNMMVIGKSGSGKSYFTKKMIVKELLSGTKCFIVDPEGEYDILTRNLGGKTIDVGGAVNGRINPFHIFPEMEDDVEGASEAQFSLQIQFLESFFKSLIPDMTDYELTILSGIFSKVYAVMGINEETKIEKLKPEDFPIIDDAIMVMEKEIEKETKLNNNIETLTALKHLRVYFNRFGTGGSLSSMWNGYTTIDASASDLIHFDFKRITSAKNDRVMNTQMMLILKFLECEVTKNREHNLRHGTKRYVAIYVDEAHVFIDEKNPHALQFMYQMIKRIRKYNGIFTIITQNVNDFVGSANIKKQTTAIINGCQYSFIFGLNPADLQSLVDLYASVGGFSKEEKSFIGGAGIGQCLFIVSPGNRIIMRKIMVDDEEAKVFK